MKDRLDSAGPIDFNAERLALKDEQFLLVKRTRKALWKPLLFSFAAFLVFVLYHQTKNNYLAFLGLGFVWLSLFSLALMLISLYRYEESTLPTKSGGD